MWQCSPGAPQSIGTCACRVPSHTRRRCLRHGAPRRAQWKTNGDVDIHVNGGLVSTLRGSVWNPEGVHEDMELMVDVSLDVANYGEPRTSTAVVLDYVAVWKLDCAPSTTVQVKNAGVRTSASKGCTATAPYKGKRRRAHSCGLPARVATCAAPVAACTVQIANELSRHLRCACRALPCELLAESPPALCPWEWSEPGSAG